MLKTITQLTRLPYNLNDSFIVPRLSTHALFTPKSQLCWRFATFSLYNKIERRHLMPVEGVSMKVLVVEAAYACRMSLLLIRLVSVQISCNILVCERELRISST